MEQHESRREPFGILLHSGGRPRLCHEIAANRHARGKRDGEQPIARLHLLNAVQRDARQSILRDSRLYEAMRRKVGTRTRDFRRSLVAAQARPFNRAAFCCPFVHSVPLKNGSTRLQMQLIVSQPSLQLGRARRRRTRSAASDNLVGDDHDQCIPLACRTHERAQPFVRRKQRGSTPTTNAVGH